MKEKCDEKGFSIFPESDSKSDNIERERRIRSSFSEATSKRDFIPFEGDVCHKLMPRLLLGNVLTPITLRQFIEKRVNNDYLTGIDGGETNYDLRDGHFCGITYTFSFLSYRKCDVVTAHVVIFNDDGEAVLAHYSVPLVRELIEGLNPQSTITKDGAIEVSNDQYHAIKRADGSLVISADDVGTINHIRAINQEKSKKSTRVLRERIFDHLLEGDSVLRDANSEINRKFIQETRYRGEKPKIFDDAYDKDFVYFHQTEKGLYLLNVAPKLVTTHNMLLKCMLIGVRSVAQRDSPTLEERTDF